MGKGRKARSLPLGPKAVKDLDRYFANAGPAQGSRPPVAVARAEGQAYR